MYVITEQWPLMLPIELWSCDAVHNAPGHVLNKAMRPEKEKVLRFTAKFPSKPQTGHLSLSGFKILLRKNDGDCIVKRTRNRGRKRTVSTTENVCRVGVKPRRSVRNSPNSWSDSTATEIPRLSVFDITHKDLNWNVSRRNELKTWQKPTGYHGWLCKTAAEEMSQEINAVDFIWFLDKKSLYTCTSYQSAEWGHPKP